MQETVGNSCDCLGRDSFEKELVMFGCCFEVKFNFNDNTFFDAKLSQLKQFPIVAAKFIVVDLGTNSSHTEKVEAFNLFIKHNEWRSLPSDKFLNLYRSFCL